MYLHLYWIYWIDLVVLVGSFRLLYINIKSCHLKIDDFSPSFLILMSFISFSGWITLARTTSTMLNSSVIIVSFLLFLILEQKLTFTMEYEVSCGFTLYGWPFSCCSTFLLYPFCIRVFIMNGFQILSDAFSVSKITILSFQTIIVT